MIVVEYCIDGLRTSEYGEKYSNQGTEYSEEPCCQEGHEWNKTGDKTLEAEVLRFYLKTGKEILEKVMVMVHAGL